MTELKGSIITLTPTKVLKVKPLDGKRLYIDTSSVAFLDIQKDEDGLITSLSLEGKYNLSKGDKFSLRIGKVISVYNIKYITIENHEKLVILHTTFLTKVNSFLLPVLGKTKAQLRYDSYYVNAYLTEDKRHISLLYRFTGTESYRTFENMIMSDPLFVSHKDFDHYHVIYTFRIPESFYEDVEHFMEGRYSFLSKALGQRILKFYGEDEASSILMIIRKDKRLKKDIEKYLGVPLSETSELASKPDLKVEIYNIK